MELSPFSWSDMSNDAAVPPSRPHPDPQVRPPARGLEGAEGTEVSCWCPPLIPGLSPSPLQLGTGSALNLGPGQGLGWGLQHLQCLFSPPACSVPLQWGTGGVSVLHPPILCHLSLPAVGVRIRSLLLHLHTPIAHLVAVGAHWVPPPPSPSAKLPPCHAWCSWLCCSAAPSALLSCLY